MKIRDSVFLYFNYSNKEFTLVDFFKKENYSLSKEYVISLIDFHFGKKIKDSIYKDFIDSSVIVDNKETVFSPFLGKISGLYSLSTKSVVVVDASSDEEFCTKYIKLCERIARKDLPKLKSSFDFQKEDVFKLTDDLKKTALFDILNKRKSIRTFYKSRVTLKQFKSVIYGTFGHIHGYEKEYKPFVRRSSPSGGCLQIINCFVVIFDVEDIESGLYWYDPYENSICLIRIDFSYEDLKDGLCKQFFANNYSFGFFYVADLERLHWKYKTNRNYVVAAMETGHLSQTAQLIATECNLNTWITGVFDDYFLYKKFNLDYKKWNIFLFNAFGKGKYLGMNGLMKEKLAEIRNQN